MDETIEKLKRNFEDIQEMGYIKSVANNNTTSGVGLTIEHLLGKKADNLPMPDYYGIELKAKTNNSKKLVELFRLNPKGNSNYEMKRLYDLYGQTDSKNIKRFSGIVKTNDMRSMGGNYLFYLNVNFQERKLNLFINDTNYKIIDTSTYWDFESIEKSLYRKLNYLAYFKADCKNIDGDFYFKYTEMTIYKLRSFDVFIELLRRGRILVNFTVDIYHSGKKEGQMHDHGTFFSISEDDLDKLFDII